MTTKERFDIEQISKEFVKGLGIELNGSGWLIADPLSAYLCACGFENTLDEIPAKENKPQILILNFKDGSKFIPAGEDFKSHGFKEAKNYMWIDGLLK